MSTDQHLEPHWDAAALITIDMQRDFRVVLVTDAVSQGSEQGFREVAGLGTVLMSTAETVEAVSRG